MSEDDYLNGVRVVSKRIPFDGIVQLDRLHYGDAATRGTAFVCGITPVKWFSHQAKLERFSQEAILAGHDHVVLRISRDNECIFEDILVSSLLIAAKDVQLLVQQKINLKIDTNSSEKPLNTTERNTLLTIIAALCDYSDIKHQDRGAASQIAKMTQEIGAAVTDDTIRKILAQIPAALETRMK